MTSFKGFMDMVETKRLFLRKFRLDDAPAVLEFLGNAEVSKYTGDIGEVKSISDAIKVITDVWFSDYKNYGYGRLALVEKDSKKVIGFCGLKYMTEFKLPDLGYRMLPEYWGKGYATESAKAALEYGVNMLGMKKIMALTFLPNEGSKKVLIKLGFSEKKIVVVDSHDCNYFEYKANL